MERLSQATIKLYTTLPPTIFAFQTHEGLQWLPVVTIHFEDSGYSAKSGRNGISGIEGGVISCAVCLSVLECPFVIPGLRFARELYCKLYCKFQLLLVPHSFYFDFLDMSSLFVMPSTSITFFTLPYTIPSNVSFFNILALEYMYCGL